ncbi:DUF4388 domain-containing protein [Pleurocapsa sp. PCC 7319]|uniref:DUF4388 domain-containing protein n=1 Tax=Pleurocapsa sp. PCC 7319 TaxID=118161 RepID=UPI0007C7B078|nr:DUF4388 domain-containing protein [Pleurocapsa sp. PCC 7319]
MNKKASAKSTNLRALKGQALSGNKFDLPTQGELFETLKQLRFDGRVELRESKGDRWTIYLHLGRVVYATGGTHPVKRWQRNIITYLPELTAQLAGETSDLSHMTAENCNRCWQYQLLYDWVKQGKINRQQATKIIWSTVVEVLFDITQAGNISYELQPGESSAQGIILIDGTRIVAEVRRQWASWQEAQATDFSPNLAPVIRKPEELQQSTSANLFEMLNQMLSKEQTLRDLAFNMKRETLSFTRSLLPYLQSGLVELINIPDLPNQC